MIHQLCRLWFGPAVLVLCLAIAQPADAQKPDNTAGLSNPMGTAASKRTYVYKVVGDCKIQADVYQKGGEAAQPVVLWIHGGALIVGSRGMLRPDQLERYLDAGFTVVAIDYRLAPETKLDGILEDVGDAYKWLRDKGPDLFQIDPNRIVVVGHSAGGYLALMAGFRFNPRPKALVSFYGYGDIAGDWYSRPDPFYSQQSAVPKAQAYAGVGASAISESGFDKRSDFYLYCRQHGLWPKEVTGHDPDREPRAFDRFCPIRNVTPAYPSTLLLHGDKDTDVPFQQSVLMAKELERNHVEHEFIPLQNRGHSFDTDNEGLQDPTVSEAYDRVIAFLKNHAQIPTKASH